MDLYDYCTQGAGQVRACVSDHIRQQDPRNFHLLGLPPVDMLEEVAKALRAAGLDVVSAFLGVAHRVSLGLSRAVGLVFD